MVADQDVQKSVRPASPGGLAIREQLYASYQCETTRNVWAVGIDDHNREYFVFQPSCKLWSCPQCAAWKTRFWVKRIATGARELQSSGECLRFVTFTSHQNVKTPVAGLRVWRKAWPRVYARCKRLKPDLQYAWVAEQGATGRFHVHMIMTEFYHEWRWKDVSAAAGLGWNTQDEGLGDSTKAARYIAKYLQKQLCRAGWPRGTRRINCSQKWPKLDDGEHLTGKHWLVVKSFAELTVRLQALEYAGFIARHDKIRVQ